MEHMFLCTLIYTSWGSGLIYFYLGVGKGNGECDMDTDIYICLFSVYSSILIVYPGVQIRERERKGDVSSDKCSRLGSQEFYSWMDPDSLVALYKLLPLFPSFSPRRDADNNDTDPPHRDVMETR